MAKYPVVLPRLGEAVIEATLTKWLKNEGDAVTEEEPIAEIATDKVDSEITSPVSGILVKRLVNEGDIIPVGKVIAEMEIEGAGAVEAPAAPEVKASAPQAAVEPERTKAVFDDPSPGEYTGHRFYSPLVKNIAKQENITFNELDSIQGTGQNDRLTKQDVLDYLERRKSTGAIPASAPVKKAATPAPAPQPVFTPGGDDQIIEMDRIRTLIANHMVRSVQTSPHVTSFIEVDMTKIVQWRDRNKDAFQKREGEKLTFTPIFIEAISKAVRDFPMVNVSVDGTRIILHKSINVGMAVALPNDNLIVPVIRDAGAKNLFGIIKNVNDIANRARVNKLLPDEVTGGTISITNLGSFGTLMGTPIINQPQTAIIAVGIIKKRPVVIETPEGDTIAIRHMMIASITYDHRVIDGALGGRFLAKFAGYLENFDNTREI